MKEVVEASQRERDRPALRDRRAGVLDERGEPGKVEAAVG
jgi:hypothetical protein